MSRRVASPPIFTQLLVPSLFNMVGQDPPYDYFFSNFNDAELMQ